MMMLLLTSAMLAQDVGGTDQGFSQGGFRIRGAQEFGPAVAYGSFSLGDEERYGPIISLQYTPNRHTFPALEFFVGALIQTGTSGAVDTRNLVPVQSYFAPYLLHRSPTIETIIPTDRQTSASDSLSLDRM